MIEKKIDIKKYKKKLILLIKNDGRVELTIDLNTQTNTPPKDWCLNWTDWETKKRW